MSISGKIRKVIAKRADYKCEYCLMHEDDMFFSFEIDHIIAKKHGGDDNKDNLAYCCPHCNQNKGSDIATFINDYEEIIPLFHPRKQEWQDHFTLVEGEIIALSKIGEATIKLLKMNHPDILIIRRTLAKIGKYPL